MAWQIPLGLAPLVPWYQDIKDWDYIYTLNTLYLLYTLYTFYTFYTLLFNLHQTKYEISDGDIVEFCRRLVVIISGNTRDQNRKFQHYENVNKRILLQFLFTCQ